MEDVWPFKVLKIEDSSEIKFLYNLGWGAERIAEKFGVSKSVIVRALHHLGVSLRSHKDRMISRGVSINEMAFSDFGSAEDAYWFGWLLADGCISDNKTGIPTVSIALARRDRKVLVNLAKYLNLPCNRVKDYEYYVKTTDKNYSMSKIAFNNHIVSENLLKMGMSQRKSTQEVAPEELKYNRHFWRGYFEGDGYISCPKSQGISVQLCGSLVICQQWKDYCESLAPEMNVSIYKKLTKDGSSICTTSSGHKENVKIVLDSLYSDVPENNILGRKYKRYVDWFELSNIS